MAPHTTSGPAPVPDPTDRPLVAKAAYAEMYARVWEWQAEFGLTLLEVVGSVQRAALEVNAVLVEAERKPPPADGG